MVKTVLANVAGVIDSLKNIAWHDKSSCDVLIFDAEGSDLIQHCIPLGAKVNVLRVREGVPLIKSVHFFLLLFMNIGKYQRLKSALMATLVKTWNPKVVITFIDNTDTLGKMKSLFPSIQCISVQNGTRWQLSRPSHPSLTFDHYFCFGKIEGDILSQNVYPVAHLYPTGSLKAGLFFAQHQPKASKEFDLCFISQFTPLDDLQTDQWTKEMLLAYYETDRDVFIQVANVAAKKNLTLCFAMSSSLGSAKYEAEKNHYAHNDQVHFIPNSQFSSYAAVQASRLSITTSSTLGYEALGMGERVIFGKDIKKIGSLVLKGSWQTNLVTQHLPDLQRLYSTSDDEFSAKAESLLEMTDDCYLAYSKKARACYMNFDKNNLPQNIIKNKIATFL